MGRAEAMKRRGGWAVVVGFMLVAASARALGADSGAEQRVAIAAANRLAADAPEWRELVAAFARQPDTEAEFVEERYFPFRKAPVILLGEVRVSRERGLSLHYVRPEERVVILDERGVLVRDARGQEAPPDKRAEGANRALLHVLRMDFPALEKEFDVYGKRGDAGWRLTLVPRDGGMRRAIGNLHVSGEGTAVRTIQLHKSEKQHIDITMKVTRAPAAFSADEVRRYFR